MEKGFTGGRGEAKGCWAASQSEVRPNNLLPDELENEDVGNEDAAVGKARS